MTKILAVLSLMLFSTAALASTPSFTDADTDQNGVLSMEEVKAALPETADEAVTAADVNQDGSIDENEYAALTAQ